MNNGELTFLQKVKENLNIIKDVERQLEEKIKQITV